MTFFQKSVYPLDFGPVDFWLLDLAAGWFSFTKKNTSWFFILFFYFFRHVISEKKITSWPETCFRVKKHVDSVTEKHRQEGFSAAVFDSSVAVAARNHWEWSTHACAIAMRSPEYHLLSQSTICAAAHLFALLWLPLFDQELRPMAAFLWRLYANDQHGLSARPIMSKFDHDMIIQKKSMPFRNDFLYLKSGARTNAPQTSNTCLRSRRKRKTGTLST